MTNDTSKSRAVLIAVLSAIALVVVIALVAVFTRGAPAPLPADTPQGVVQRYSQAIVDGDVDEALGYLVPAVADDCERMPLGTDDFRVTLLETTESGDTARVRTMVVTIYGSGPLGQSEYESEELFELERIEGDWLIARAPWQLSVCVDQGLG